MNKIEAAERLAEAVEEYKLRVSGLCFSDMVNALAAYRSASVPCDQELGRVAYEGAYASCAKWDDVPKEYGRLWTDAAAAVREWVQRDGLTDHERAVIVDAMQAYLVGDPKCEPARSILRKLGHETEPVWEWDDDDGALYLNDWLGIRIAEITFTSLGVRRWTKWDTGDAGDSWTVAEAKAWCEQQLRNANLKGATDGKQD